MDKLPGGNPPAASRLLAVLVYPIGASAVNEILTRVQRYAMDVQILVAGDPRQQPGPTPELLRRYRRRLLDGVSSAAAWPGLWITLNHQAVAQTRTALAANGPVLAPGVMTFDHLADAILCRSRRPVVPLSLIQRRRLLRQLIDAQAVAGQFAYHASVVDGSGFLAEVDRLIADLKRNYTWPEQFARRSSDRRHTELAQLYTTYQKTLHEAGLYDTQGCFWAAGDALRADPDLAQGTSLLVVDRFTDFTEAQWRILELLIPRCQEVVVTLPLDAELVDPAAASGRQELFGKSRATLATLREKFSVQVSSAAADSDDPPQVSSSAEPLPYLRHALFRQPASEDAEAAPDARGVVEIIEASSDDCEAREVARRVKRLLLDGRLAEDIVIARRRLASEADRLRAVLADYGIACSFDHAAPLIVTPTVRACLALLRLAVEDWPYRELLRVINQSQFSALADHERRAAELAIRRAQIPEGRQKLLDMLQRTGPANPGDAAQPGPSLALRTLRRLSDALDLLPRSGDPTRWTQQLTAVADRLGLTIGAEPAGRLFLRGLYSLATLDRWTARRSTSLSAREFLAAATQVAREQSLGGGPRAGHVLVVEAETVRGMSPRHLLLMGLGEQSFPAPLRPGQAAEPTTAEAHASDEMLLFYQIVAQAGESLTLSYAGLDAKAQQLEPSPYLLEIERIFSREKLSWTKLELQPGVSCDDPYSQTEERIAAAASIAEGRPTALATFCRNPRTALTGAAVTAGLEAVASRARRDVFGAWEGRLAGEATRRRLAEKFGADRPWSTSRLEKYASCPFKFLGEYGLKLKPLPDLALENDARDRGALLHMALSIVHRELMDEDEEAVRDTILDRFRATLSRLVEEDSPPGLQGALREIQRRELLRDSKELAEQTARYQKHYERLDGPPRPHHFEVRFGPSYAETDKLDDPLLSTDSPFLLQLPNEQIAITGQIDRIDLGQEAGRPIFNIIDYKSGASKKFSTEEALAGRLLQLPLYAMVVEQMLLKDAGVQPYAAGYWNIRGKGFIADRGKGDDGLLEMSEASDGQLRETPAWQQLKVDLLERIEALIAGIRDGAFAVFNENEQCTRYCDLAKICRISQIRSLDKKWPEETTEPPEASAEETGR